MTKGRLAEKVFGCFEIRISAGINGALNLEKVILTTF